ncbi:lipoyl(octanoyl) transferase LipB [Alistipes sp. OttesenSCG-928-B03]|nr:lipoyl(octanoyl) transferase LipB [Alistipes sp. OttesenSCG-928-B03]
MKGVLYRDAGLIDYKECWDLQRGIFDSLVAQKVAAAKTGSGSDAGVGSDGAASGNTTASSDAAASRSANETAADTNTQPTLILCEHPHVYTLGRSGAEANMLMSEEFIRSVGATYYHIDRGGDITYHGPGQLVGYPIIDLDELGLGLKEYIHLIEEAVIDTIADWGIKGGRSQGATGVWLSADARGGERKICAIGVRSSRFVTMHGFALNVNTQLEYFGYINPCGFTDRGVTSIEKELGEKVEMDAVKQSFLKYFAQRLGIQLN